MSSTGRDDHSALTKSDAALKHAQDAVDGILEDISAEWPRQPARLPDSLIVNVQSWVLGLLVKLRVHELPGELADKLEPDRGAFGNERPTPYVLPEDHPSKRERETVRRRRGESPHSPAQDPWGDEEVTEKRSPYAHRDDRDRSRGRR